VRKTQLSPIIPAGHWLGERTPLRAGYSPLDIDAAPTGDPSRLLRAGSAKRLSVSLLSWATRRRLRVPSRAAEGSRCHGWRVGRGCAARLGAHCSQGWRKLRRGEGLRGKLVALGRWEGHTSDFVLARARAAPRVLRDRQGTCRCNGNRCAPGGCRKPQPGAA
jgi:hypothetical protein